MAKHPPKKPKPKRKRMIKFRLDEISPVDTPAQEGATLAIMKRDGDNSEVAKKAALTTSSKDHSHLIRLDFDGVELNSGETSWTGENPPHPWVRTEDGNIVIGRVDGHIHSLATVSKSDETPQSEMTPEEIEKQKQEFEALEKRLIRAEKLAELNDAQREYHKGLATEVAETFLAKSNDDRQTEVEAELSKSLESNPEIYKADNGDVFRADDDPRLVTMAKERDLEKRETQKYRVEIERARFEKQAQEVLSNTAGETPVKIELLKAVAGIADENFRNAALEVLKSADGAFSILGTPTGASGESSENTGEAKLTALAKSIQTRDGVSYLKAYNDALDTAEGQAFYAENAETLRQAASRG